MTSVNISKCPLCNKDRHDPGFKWKFTCLLNVLRTQLISHVNVGGLFFAHLEQKGVLDAVAISKIRSGSEYEQKEKLFKRLEDCDDNKLDAFLEVLTFQKQESIVDRIRQHFNSLQETGHTEGAAAASVTVASPPVDPNYGKLSQYPEDNFDVLVDVKKTSEEFYQENSKQAFPMTSDPRGTALIFNIFKTTGKEDRRGTMADRDNLVKLFKRLHFNVKVYSDVKNNGVDPEPESMQPTAENILKKIKTTLDGMTPSDQCFVVVTLSHGGINEKHQEVLYGCDGKPVTKKEILDVITEKFNEYTEFKDMPRLVFFQCCRGENQMMKLTTEGTDCTEDRANTLYCHSCTREYVSNRNKRLGTRFVRAMVDTFAKHACNTDIVGLMDKVKEAMKEIDPRSEFDQIPQPIFDRIFVDKKLYFFP